MRELVIVDGYNLIFHQELIKEAADLAHARERLLNRLAQYAALTGIKVVVVFDAYRVRGGREHAEQRDGLTVIFTAEGEAADTVIERLSSRLADYWEVSVVTADAAEQRLVLGHGALRVPPKEFSAKVDETLQQSQQTVAHGSRPGDDYLENRLADDVRAVLTRWRQGKQET
ncbi:MAG: NYN domain-containing protein [Bacillota bacterium]